MIGKHFNYHLPPSPKFRFEVCFAVPVSIPLISPKCSPPARLMNIGDAIFMYKVTSCNEATLILNDYAASC